MGLTLTELRKVARKRSALLRKSEKGLLDRAATMERRLNAYVLNTLLPSLDISGGNIKNSQANLAKINKASGLKRFIKNVVNVAMFDYYDKQFNSLTGATDKYFSRFEPTEAAKDRIINRGKSVIDGFVDDLFDNNQVGRALQESIRTAVRGERNLTDFKALITEQIKGKEDKFGLIKSYHYQNGYNEFQAYSRGLDNDFSTALNLNYAIYAGGEIKTTRAFCDSRNGNVYNRETILSWNDLDWQGKKPGNDILIDMGGFNCRHDFDWISFALARRIEPNIEKSKFDKR